jgi:hypothetical protein
VQACAWWIDDDYAARRDVFERFFAGREYGFCPRFAELCDVLLHFAYGMFV